MIREKIRLSRDEKTVAGNKTMPGDKSAEKPIVAADVWQMALADLTGENRMAQVRTETGMVDAQRGGADRTIAGRVVAQGDRACMNDAWMNASGILNQGIYHTEGSAADWTEMRFMSVSDLKVAPEYQRLLNLKWAQEIADNFNPDLVQVLQISYRDGQYYIIDGQHTTKAIRIRFKDNEYPLLCKIYYGLTKQEEAQMFYLFNKCRKSMDSASMLKAQLASGKEEVTEFFKCTRDAGFIIDPVKRSNCQYGIVAVRTAQNCFRGLGTERYLRMLNLLKATWDGKRWSLTQQMLNAMATFLAAFEDQIDDKTFIRQLRNISENDLLSEAGTFAAQGRAISLASAMVTFYNKRRRNGRLDYQTLALIRR